MAKILPIQFKRKTSGTTPTAAQVLEGELVLNLLTKTIYTKDHTGNIIELGVGGSGGEIGGNLRVRGTLTVDENTTLSKNLSVAGTTQLVGNVQSNGQIRVGTTTSNGIIAFSLADKTNIRGNINGALVITGYGGDSAGSNAIHIRPSGDTMSNSGEIIIQRDGTIVAPKAQLTSLSVSGDSQQNTATFKGAVNLNNTVSINATGSFNNASVSTFTKAINAADINASGLTLTGTLKAGQVTIQQGTNPVIQMFNAAGEIRAEIFGMSSASEAMRLRPVGLTSGTGDLILDSSGNVSVSSFLSRRNAVIRSADTTNWSTIDFQDSNGTGRAVLYADSTGAIGLRNRALTLLTLGSDNGVRLNRGWLEVGYNSSGNQEGNDAAAKALFFNKGFMDFYGTNASAISGGYARTVNMIKANFGGTSWATQDYSEQRDDQGIVQRVFHVSSAINNTGNSAENAWFLMKHNGDFDVPRNIKANNVQITSDIRFKDNLQTIESALDKVDAINGCTYDLKTSQGPVRSAGVIAQDVLKVLPEAVDQSNPDHLTLEYSALVGLLINAVKELRQEVKQLRGE